ncbi:MAG: O-antigen ligase family protein [Nanoarchaeota archaeon]|nr:O-antigen ligase family protein [Nanoarchaeota archaeon]
MKTLPWFSISKFFLFLTPFAIIIVTKSTLFPFIVGKYIWFRSSVALALIAFLCGLLFETRGWEEYGKKIIRVLKTPLGITVTAFAGIFILAGFLGIRPSYSFWSNFERGEGGLQMLNLYILFLLLATLFQKESDWRKFFWAALWAAFCMVLYGVGAGLGYNGFIGEKFGEPNFRFQGSLGNSSYVAALLIFAAFYGAYILATRYSKRLFFHAGSILIWIFFGVYGAAFLLAGTRGAFLGLIGGIFVGLAYLGYAIKSWRKWAIAIAVVLAVTAGSLITFRDSEFVKRIPGSRIFDISFTTTTLQHRTIMWQIAWWSFKERPILGWGPENFGVLFQKNFNPRYFEPDKGFGAWFDRAHNVIFDYLASVGILGTLAYVSIFAVIYWNILRGKIEKNAGLSPGIAAFVLAVPTAYLVQGIALFDILPTYLNLFMFFAFAWYLFYGNHEKNNKK